MSREIKVRAWDLVAKKFYYVDVWNFHILAENCDDVQQYIGRNDDNDNEICEGDLVKLSNPVQQIQNIELIGEVRYSNFGSYKICNIKAIKWENFTHGVKPPEYIWFLNLGDRKIEIIGNIYENPELIKGD